MTQYMIELVYRHGYCLFFLTKLIDENNKIQLLNNLLDNQNINYTSIKFVLYGLLLEFDDANIYK